MEFICGTNRNQGTFLPDTVDDYVSANNPVRVIDAYVETLDMESLGFEKYEPNSTGRPMYNPKDLLKLYLYGYMNRVRSSRNLETETKRNLEVMWLLGKLSPDHKTIARFRQNNPNALKNVFRHFVKTCMSLGLYGKELIAVDGSKFKAWNTKDRNFTSGKLEDRIKNIDCKIESYLALLNESDKDDTNESELSEEDVLQILQNLSERKEAYAELKQQIDETGVRQISLTDPDSRLMKTKDGLDVCLNVQSAVDSKNNMIAEFRVENQVQDKNLMGSVAIEAAETLGVDTISVVADAGYDSSSDIAGLIAKGFDPHVCGANYDICIPCEKIESEFVSEYTEGRCVYIPNRNIFICPMGQVLYPHGINKNKQIAKYYNCTACRSCTHKCTASRYKIAERQIHASEFGKEYDDTDLYIKQFKVRADRKIIRQRKSIIEHTFGTIKRALGISYLLLRGKEKVTGEISLAFTAFNMKRAINLLGTERLIQAIQA